MRIIMSVALAMSLGACTKSSADDAGDKSEPVASAKVSTQGAALAFDAPTLDSVLSKHFDAIGGEANLRAATSLSYSGTVYKKDKQYKISKHYARPNKFRKESHDGETSKVTVFDGTNGWKQVAGKTEPLPDKKIAYMKKDSMDDALLVYKERGYKVRLVGEADVHGTRAFHLEIAKGDDGTEQRFIDAKTYYEIKRHVTWKGKDGKPGQQTIYFSDFRDVGNGMVVNFRTKFKSDKGKGKFVVDKAAYNQPIDDALFERPGNI